MFEPWPDEPEEDNPESRWGSPESKWGDPERDLPRIPEVSTKESDVDPHVFKSFWVSVVFTNVAVLGVSLGAMLWFFRGQALLGGALVGVGVLAGLRTYASYRSFKNGNGPETEAASTDGETTESDGPGADEDSGADDGPTDPEGWAIPENTGAGDADRTNAETPSGTDADAGPERNG